MGLFTNKDTGILRKDLLKLFMLVFSISENPIAALSLASTENSLEGTTYKKDT